MRNGGLEPPSLSTYVPETYASTNSASSAIGILQVLDNFDIKLADIKCGAKIAECQ